MPHDPKKEMKNTNIISALKMKTNSCFLKYGNQLMLSSSIWKLLITRHLANSKKNMLPKLFSNATKSKKYKNIMGLLKNSPFDS